MLDPAAGARRRALVRDKAVRGATVTGRGIDAVARDIARRTVGVAAAARGWSREQVDDITRPERVRGEARSRLFAPHAIDVEPRDGEVTLRGPILAREMDDVLAMTASVRGVRSVINELEPHHSPQGIPSLPGEGRVAGRTLDILQSNWAPATRALVGLCAAASAALGIAAYMRR